MTANLRTLANHWRTVRGISETIGLTPLFCTWQPLVERGRQTHLLPAISTGNINTTVVGSTILKYTCHISPWMLVLSDWPDDKWWNQAWWPEVSVIKQERVILLTNKNWRKSCCARHYRNVSTVSESFGTTTSESFRTIGAYPPHVSWKTEPWHADDDYSSA